VIASSSARTPFAYDTLDFGKAAIHMGDSVMCAVARAAHFCERGLNTSDSSKDLVVILDSGSVAKAIHLVEHSVYAIVHAILSNVEAGLKWSLLLAVVHVEIFCVWSDEVEDEEWLW
jgi:hypothetical protein